MEVNDTVIRGKKDFYVFRPASVQLSTIATGRLMVRRKWWEVWKHSARRKNRSANSIQMCLYCYTFYLKKSRKKEFCLLLSGAAEPFMCYRLLSKQKRWITFFCWSTVSGVVIFRILAIFDMALQDILRVEGICGFRCWFEVNFVIWCLNNSGLEKKDQCISWAIIMPVLFCIAFSHWQFLIRIRVMWSFENGDPLLLACLHLTVSGLMGVFFCHHTFSIKKTCYPTQLPFIQTNMKMIWCNTQKYHAEANVYRNVLWIL